MKHLRSILGGSSTNWKALAVLGIIGFLCLNTIGLSSGILSSLALEADIGTASQRTVHKNTVRTRFDRNIHSMIFASVFWRIIPKTFSSPFGMRLTRLIRPNDVSDTDTGIITALTDTDVFSMEP